MATTLINNLNSSYFEALNSMRAQAAPEMIKVYVESDMDIAHWNKIFTSFKLDRVKFDISLPTSTGYEKGKVKVLELFRDSVGKNLILCVDSDYDYLLPNRNWMGQLMKDSEFIFQTYTYSIENLYSHHLSLDNFCIHCVKKTDIATKLSEIVLKYSTFIFELFCWNVYFHHIGKEDLFTITDFANTSKILINNDLENNYISSFECLQARIKNRLDTLIKDNYTSISIDNFEEFKGYLLKKGITTENCYLYAQGHLILENVVLMFLQPVVKRERAKKIKAIMDSNTSGEQKENQRNHYAKIVIKENMLIHHIYSNDFPLDIPEYLQTKQDIQKYISTYLN